MGKRAIHTVRIEVTFSDEARAERLYHLLRALDSSQSHFMADEPYGKLLFVELTETDLAKLVPSETA